MKLLRLLRNKPFCNDFHFLLIAVIIFLIAIKYPLFFILLAIYLVFIYKNTKYLLPILIIISLIFLIHTIQNNKKLEDKEYYYADIINVIDNESYIIKIDNIKILAYEKNHSYSPGDKIKCKLKLYDKSEKSSSNDFDYNEYLLSKGISFSAKVLESKFIKSGFSINNIKYNYLNYLEKHLSNASYQYVEALVFGNNNIDDELNEGYQILGLSHILAISGLHILMLYKIISFLLLKLFKYRYSLIPITIITIYVIIIGYPPSCLRALLFLIIGALNNKAKIKYTKLDILSISMLIMILMNPYQIYQTGFILSYLVSFILIFSNEIIKKNNGLIGSYKLHLLIYFLTLPFVASISNKISITSLLLAPILTTITTIIVMPLSFILAIFPILDILINPIFSLFNSYIIGLNKSSFAINIPTLNIYIKALYYLIYSFIIVSIIKERRRLISIIYFSFFIFIIANYRLFNPFHKITFIDVGQGDSAIIELKNNKGIVLIDAYNCNDYLMSTGLSTIDYLILTHSDNDHIGDLEIILDNYNIKNILIPKYDNGFEMLEEYSYKAVDYNYGFYMDDVYFDIIGPINRYSDTNSNSIVIKVNIEGYKFLFCGDMTIEEENDLINQYSTYLDSDVLKVGHHGSKTSSSEEFLEYVTPKYSIVSVGLNNYYGLPDIEVMNRLSKYEYIYQTRYNGNIEFYIFNEKLWARAYK
ncbi:MAG: DNA internalization-related competence protein ComEC/Rec2 [Acholeplasmatales bacterium]|nr:DNA internalization-related competence protein ComEC/Rec2 [Acholeplasmatales bacterium]